MSPDQLTILPIAQAPKDGTVILGYFDFPFINRIDECHAYWRPIRWCGWGGGVWQCASSGLRIGVGEQPIAFAYQPQLPTRSNVQKFFHELNPDYSEEALMTTFQHLSDKTT